MSDFGRHWIGGIVLLTVFVGVCIWATNWRTERMIASAYESCGTPDAIRMEELGLTQSQKDAIRSLEKSYRAKVVDLCGKHCGEKMKLAKLLTASPRDDNAIAAASENAARIEAETERLTTQHILSMARAMNEKQAEVFLRKFSEEVVKTCPIQFAPETR